MFEINEIRISLIYTPIYVYCVILDQARIISVNLVCLEFSLIIICFSFATTTMIFKN